MKGCTTTGLCRLSGITRQAYYKQCKIRQRQRVNDELIINLVRNERSLQPRIGSKKLLIILQKVLLEAGLEIGRDRFHAVLKRHDLLVAPKKKAPRTTYFDKSLPVFRNLLNDLEATAVHQVWTNDITYIDTDEGYLYLSLVMDRQSRTVVGWNAGETLEAKETIKALNMAIEQLPANCFPIHHSDRGSQYCCHEYVQVLQDRGLSISMTENNHCYENSHAERLNGILKDEYNLDYTFKSKEQALKAIEQSIYLYNNRRPHSSLKMKYPIQVHHLAA